MDSVNMPKGKHGYKYVVDLVDNLTGFLEATKLKHITSDKVTDFLFDVMCRYRCIFQLTIDNSSEFKGAVQSLMDRYRVPVVWISPYNPQANGKSKRGHAVWINALWKICAIRIYDWPDYLGYAIWADCVTVKQNTGYTPYYLLYGQHPLMPYDVNDRTFHSLDWPSIESTEDLLALRMLQLSKREDLLEEAVLANAKSWLKAADTFNRKHTAKMAAGEYAPGKWVIVYNKALDNQHGSKGMAKWFGPFIIIQRRPSGAYVVQQPDGVILHSPIAWKRLKLYHYQENREPVVRTPVWNQEDEDMNIAAIMQTRIPPRKSQPWNLDNPDKRERYWTSKYESCKRRALGLDPKLEPDDKIDPDVKADQELWDYHHDHPDNEHNPLQFPFGVKFLPDLFNWLPWGSKKVSKDVGMKTLNRGIEISMLTVIGFQEQRTIVLRGDCDQTKRDHGVPINIAAKDLGKVEPLTFTCNMMD
jgi:hypothetical protein